LATGSYIPNFHEGSRSEYIAQYIFSAFGTSVPVPHQEDHGIDLFCTISERKGSRAWPIAYYSVQVKSTDEAWVFTGRESVDWLLKYPAPLLLCVVDKKLAQVRIYQITARFQAAVRSEPPSAIRLMPGLGGEGEVCNWGDRADGKFELSAPILQFTIEDLLDEETFKNIRQILDFWVFHDLSNVRRLQMGLRSAWMISSYTTNMLPGNFFLVTDSEVHVPQEIRTAGEMMLWEQLDWLGPIMLSANDRLGALLATLMLRHIQLENDELDTSLHKPFLYYGLRRNGKLDATMGTTGVDDPFAPFDALLKKLQDECTDDDLPVEAGSTNSNSASRAAVVRTSTPCSLARAVSRFSLVISAHRSVSAVCAITASRECLWLPDLSGSNMSSPSDKRQKLSRDTSQTVTLV